MKIKIYQVNSDRDTKRVIFMDFHHTAKIQGSSEINSSIYDCVFEGNVDCKNLEDVFTKFNTNYPDGYRARSLSVSDVVEVVESDDVKSGFYFCNNYGFKQISFDSNKAELIKNQNELSKKNTISVLLVKPGEQPKTINIEDTLEAMQGVVGGYIEEYMPFDDEVAIICNEEGKISGLPYNRAIYGEEDGKKVIQDIIAGPFFVAYAPAEAENFMSLPKNLADKYKDKFKYPERFSMTNKGIKVIPIKPISKEEVR